MRPIFICALAALVLLPLTAQADNWDRTDAALGAAALTATVIDWSQTRYVAKNPCPHAGGGSACTDPYREAGLARHFIGEYPTVGKVDRYFAGVVVVGGLVAHALPSDYRKVFLGLITVMEINVTTQNRRIGLRMEF